MTRRVWYAGRREGRDPYYGLPLTPGWNDVEADIADLLVAQGVVMDDEMRPSSREGR